jgi:MFS family permease
VPAEDLVPALSLTQVSWSIIRIVGPAAGGGIFSAVGARPAFAIEVVVYLASFMFLSRLQIANSAVRATGGFIQSAWRDFIDGLRTVWNIRVVRAITGTEALWSLIAASLSIAVVVLTEEELDLGNRASTIYSLMVASLSAGAVIGALIAHRVEASFGRARLMVVGYFGPLFMVPVMFTPPTWCIFVLFFLLGFTDAWAVISYQSFLAEAVGDELRGRVYATWGAMVISGSLIASVVVGWSTTHLGAAVTIGLAGLIVGIGGPLILVLSGAGSVLRSSHTTTIS